MGHATSMPETTPKSIKLRHPFPAQGSARCPPRLCAELSKFSLWDDSAWLLLHLPHVASIPRGKASSAFSTSDRGVGMIASCAWHTSVRERRSKRHLACSCNQRFGCASLSAFRFCSHSCTWAGSTCHACIGHSSHRGVACDPV